MPPRAPDGGLASQAEILPWRVLSDIVLMPVPLDPRPQHSAGRGRCQGYNRAPAAEPARYTYAMSLSQPKVGFVSLGCPKALVDSERILTQLRVEGYDIVPTYDDADVVVVNTCGFIDSAVAESLDAIGEALAENGKVIVTGCLGKRPEVIR